MIGDPDRPRYHLMPPSGWMNEPHGILHWRGRHHAFYQRNPAGPFWADIEWGHAVSDDLVHWEDVGSALTPRDVPLAPQGIWSGSSAIDEHGPILFFTAGDDRDTPNQRTLWARPADANDPELQSWQAAPAPVATLHDATDGLDALGLRALPREFRDPFVFVEDGRWFQLVGAGIEGAGGTALLFTAAAAEGPWRFERPLLVGDAERRPDTGVMWELPVLLPLEPGPDGRPRHAFGVTPWWPDPCEHSLLHQWFWTGTWDPSTAVFQPDSPDPVSLDIGGHFTGATGSIDGSRSLVWTIAQDLLPAAEHHRRGWAGNAGLPVELLLHHDGDLGLCPIPELARLRTKEVDVEVATGTVRAGAMTEIETTAVLEQGEILQVEVFRDGMSEPTVTIEVRRDAADAGELRVMRAPTHRPERDDRSGRIKVLSDGTVHLHLFVDHSMVEAYVNSRRSVTTRAYAPAQTAPRHDHQRISTTGRFVDVSAWELAAAEPPVAGTERRRRPGTMKR